MLFLPIQVSTGCESEVSIQAPAEQDKKDTAADSFTSFTSFSVGALERSDLIAGLICLVLWIVLFSGGILIGTERYRNKMAAADELSASQLFTALAIVLTCYTVTNVAILCCISSLLGGIYRNSTRRLTGSMEALTAEIRHFPYLVQGFVVYLLLISGLFLLGEEPFSNLTPTKYIRLAGSASLFAFMTGYRPRIFYKWLERLDEMDRTGARKKA